MAEYSLKDMMVRRTEEGEALIILPYGWAGSLRSALRGDETYSNKKIGTDTHAELKELDDKLRDLGF